MMTMSVKRISTASGQPRKYPEHAPITTPTRPASTPMMIMMMIEFCVPRIVMAK